jgi:hypothetical protein
MTTNGQFFDLNASSYFPPSNRPSPPSTRPPRKLAAVSEPDRSHVAGAAPPAETTLRSRPEPEEPAEVAAKKKRKRAKTTAEMRTVGVARVDKLIAAGNPAEKATAAVAKELGVSTSAVAGWRAAARKAGKLRPSKRGRRTNGARPIEPPPLDMIPTGELGARFVELIGGAIAPIIRQIVRREIKAAFMQGAES